MNPDDLKKRTKQFALRILKLVAALPNTVAGRAIGNQLVRAGTAVPANYRAACRRPIESRIHSQAWYSGRRGR
ncbi:MAG: four helix bundle protein [Pyrinomonadaceae bacterium]